MEMKSAHSAALMGIRRGQQGLSRNAAEVAGTVGSGTGAEVAKALVESKGHARAIEASARVVETADKALGSLLDVKA